MKWMRPCYLCLIFIAAGLIGCDDASSPGEIPGAGAAAFDAQAATDQLNVLQLQFQAVLEEGGNINALVDQTFAYVEHYPRVAAGRVLLGQLELMRGNLEVAAEQFELSLQINPKQPEVQVQAGAASLRHGNLDRAEHHFSQAIGLETGNAHYRVYLAQVYLKRNELDQAQMTLLEAIRLDSSVHQARASLSEVYAKQNKLDLAFTQIDHAIERSQAPERYSYLRVKARLQLRANQPKGALVTLKALPAKQLIDMTVSQELANCWAMLGHPARAAEHFEQIASMQPSNDLALAAAAEWYLQAEQSADAQRMLKKLRRVNPRHEAITTLQAQLDQPVEDRLK